MRYQIYEAKSVKYDAQQRVGISSLILGPVTLAWKRQTAPSYSNKKRALQKAATPAAECRALFHLEPSMSVSRLRRKILWLPLDFFRLWSIIQLDMANFLSPAWDQGKPPSHWSVNNLMECEASGERLPGGLPAALPSEARFGRLKKT